jgi:hypothetical protein
MRCIGTGLAVAVWSKDFADWKAFHGMEMGMMTAELTSALVIVNRQHLLLRAMGSRYEPSEYVRPKKNLQIVR